MRHAISIIIQNLNSALTQSEQAKNSNLQFFVQLSFLFFFFAIGSNCTPPAIDDFPADIFTRQQRQAGAVIFHITVSLYLFLALAVVCDKYFVPAVERISKGTLSMIDNNIF